jgi:hypothetical protein
VQPVEARAPRVGFGKPAHRARHLRLKLRELARDWKSRIRREREHDHNDGRTRHEGLRWRPDEFHDEEAHEQNDTADVGDDMKLTEHFAEHRACQHASVPRVGRLQHAKRRGRDQESQNNHSPEPHDERCQRDITDCEHRVIIIGAVNGAAIDWLTGAVLQAAARDEPIAPAAVTLLLRCYAHTGRDDVLDVLGPALARALDIVAAHDPAVEHDSSWLMVFAEAATLSDDERLPAAAARLTSALRCRWPQRSDVSTAMRSVDACLHAASIIPEETAATDVIRAAIDELERIIGVAYEPGGGLSHLLYGSDEGGALRDYIDTAAALLTAYTVTGRLPYSMLAEELMQVARRTWWDDRQRVFVATRESEPSEALNLELFLVNCAAARVFCRLAALHADDEYRRMAVIAVNSDYARDAESTLESLASSYREHGVDAAVYGLAVGELLSVR